MQDSGLLEEPRWYAVCTNPRHEKQVAAQLGTKGLEYFLPLFDSVHHWKDRRKNVELPLFPGYVFVRLALSERLRVLSTYGISRFVTFGGPPAPLDEVELTRLRNGLAQIQAEPHPYLRIGSRVLIKHGPFCGTEGILTRKKDRLRVVLSVDMLMQSIAVELDAADLQKLN